MAEKKRTLWIPHCIAALIILLLMSAFAQVAHGQADWTEKNVSPLHPKDMTQTERQEWDKKLDEINKALDEISDPNEYERNEYECNKFSDFTAAKLEEKCFTVKRAMSTEFEFPDGTTGQHHWVFIVTKVDNKEVWVPVECSPPEGQKQKQEERVDQWPLVAHDKGYFDPEGRLRPGDKFDERYFGKIKVKDVPKTTQCRDPLAALMKTVPFAICTRDALTGEALSLPISVYQADGTLYKSLNTGSDGRATLDLPPDTYYVKAKINILWFHVTAYSSPQLMLDTPYDLNIMVSTFIPVKYVPIAVYALCGLIGAFIIYRLVRLIL